MTVFLGQTVEGGVDSRLATALVAVESHLRELHRNGGVAVSFEQWAGIREPHKGTHPGGYHGQGIAIDMNYTTNPYIATRSGGTFGGESGTSQQVRSRAVDVYDRAVAFTFSGSDRSDTSWRVHDTIEQSYDHFQAASDCLAYYFSTVFSSDPVQINRPPVHGFDDLGDGDQAFGAFGGELVGGLDAAGSAIAELTKLMTEEWYAVHPGWPAPEQMYWQMLRDFEAVRIPMVFGNPSDVRSTRNPARGLFDLRREVVLAMVDIGGMSWGACDFGPSASGDMMHFDLGSH